MLLTMVLLFIIHLKFKIRDISHKMTCNDRRHLDFTCGADKQSTPYSGFFGILYAVRFTSIFTDILNLLKILVTKS